MTGRSRSFLIHFLIIYILLNSLIHTSLYSLGFDQSHQEFTKLLKNNVKNGLVDYESLKKERESLKKYLQSLSSVTQEEFQKFTKDEQLAFLINAYNAFTLELILENYPIKSIGDIGGPLRVLNLARGTPWKKFTFPLLGGIRNLDWIEHSKLRVDYNEPRIHFAINCASMGCPALRNEAYIGKNLNNQLQEATIQFLTDVNKNYYDEKNNILYLSKIFEWFAEDFVKDSGSVLDFVKKYYPKKEKLNQNPQIRYLNYDWSLNKASST